MKQSSEKIGFAIITCNRKFFFEKCINSIPELDEVVVVNDGKAYESNIYPSKVTKIIQNDRNRGIAYSKNAALKYMLEEKCKHLFLCEDDIALKDSDVIYKYINASKVSGIYHFNYGFHGDWNRDSNGEPVPRFIKKYDNETSLTFNRELTGALSYFRDEVIESVGLIDEFYKNVFEHVDHTFRIIKKGFHPPLYWFADIENSYEYILELDPKLEKSLNTKSNFNYWIRIKFFTLYFILKNGRKPHKFYDATEDEVVRILDKMKLERGKSAR